MSTCTNTNFSAAALTASASPRLVGSRATLSVLATGHLGGSDVGRGRLLETGAQPGRRCRFSRGRCRRVRPRDRRLGRVAVEAGEPAQVGVDPTGRAGENVVRVRERGPGPVWLSGRAVAVRVERSVRGRGHVLGHLHHRFERLLRRSCWEQRRRAQRGQAERGVAGGGGDGCRRVGPVRLQTRTPPRVEADVSARLSSQHM